MAIYSIAASQRITHWITRPFSRVHLQRYIPHSPQLLSNSTSRAEKTVCSIAKALSGNSTKSLHTTTTPKERRQESIEPLTQSAKKKNSKHAAAASTETSSSSSATTSPNDQKSSSSSSAQNTSTSTSPSPSAVAFNYLLAASWHPKTRRKSHHAMTTRHSDGSEDEESNVEWWKQKLRPGKVDAGEDAFFHVSTPRRVALGVADGVGGWAEVGVDPALFSWALMDNAEAVARLTDVDNGSDDKTTGGKILDAQTILDGAYTELVKEGKVKAGSSTACILSLCKLTGTLRASNLGDSAYLLIRNNQCVYESPSQQHFWNCPYQLTVLPPGYPGAGQHVMDMPKDAAQTTHQLQDGDVIVLATDGFWDNVFTEEAIELVDRELGDLIRNKDSVAGKNMPVADVLASVRTLSQRLTNTARRFSLDQKRRTPFSSSAIHIRSGG
ncbi:Protein phosphatase PTC7 [Podila epigama]|nr:Protein phosphatase PTC7 [Podila epigama]